MTPTKNSRPRRPTALHPELLDLADRLLGLRTLFREQISSLADGTLRSKPHPDLFTNAATRTGTAPEQCVVIEDAPHGIEAAHRAGMPCIALTTTHPHDALVAAELIVDHFSEIPPYLSGCKDHRTRFPRGTNL
ncbi:HAD family hydrolase [Streptomyces sp. NPDC127051]|uniref:HAD family hydrolase n=1 Tax=Streptomyces sp. NPDC127051 TaxID=3347119 RepID=UPI0036648636